MTEHPIHLPDDFAAAVRDGQKSAARERPIIMGAESVKAILAGIKTETRRALTFQPGPSMVYAGPWVIDGEQQYTQSGHLPPFHLFRNLFHEYRWRCPYGEPGDRLWVKEAHYLNPWILNDPRMGAETPGAVLYRADGGHDEITAKRAWRSPMFMPRWASRLTLAITGIRAERVQAIDTAGLRAEGMRSTLDYGPILYDMYARTWDELNKRRGYGWEKNPRVWVITFKAIRP